MLGRFAFSEQSLDCRSLGSVYVRDSREKGLECRVKTFFGWKIICGGLLLSELHETDYAVYLLDASM